MAESSFSYLLELFPENKFKLLRQPTVYKDEDTGKLQDTFCSVCTMTVKGSVYHCNDKEADVHPTCAKLHKTILVSNLEYKLIQEKKSELKDCLLCNRPDPRGGYSEIQGFRYYPTSGANGNLTIHAACWIALLEIVAKEMKKKKNNKNEKCYLDDGWKKLIPNALSTVFGDPTGIVVSVLLELLSA